MASTKGKDEKKDKVEPEPAPKGDQVFYSADLELERLNKFTARYRVADPQGAPVDIHHVEVARAVLPDDVDFNFDFIGKDLSKSPDKNAVKKQEYFRSFMGLKLQILK